MLACLVSYVTRTAFFVTRLEFVRTSGRGATQAVPVQDAPENRRPSGAEPSMAICVENSGK